MMKLFAALLTVLLLGSWSTMAYSHSRSKTTVYVNKTYVTKSVRHKRFHYHVRTHGHGHHGYRRGHRGYSYGYRRGYREFGVSVGHRSGGHH